MLPSPSLPSISPNLSKFPFTPPETELPPPPSHFPSPSLPSKRTRNPNRKYQSKEVCNWLKNKKESNANKNKRGRPAKKGRNKGLKMKETASIVEKEEEIGNGMNNSEVSVKISKGKFTVVPESSNLSPSQAEALWTLEVGRTLGLTSLDKEQAVLSKIAEIVEEENKG